MSKNFQPLFLMDLANMLDQCFPTFLGLRHPTEKNNDLRYP